MLYVIVPAAPKWTAVIAHANKQCTDTSKSPAFKKYYQQQVLKFFFFLSIVHNDHF